MKTTAVALKITGLLLLSGIMVSCKKVDIAFGDTTITDPNISYIDTLTYRISTIQSDSFITSQTSALLIGNHTDTAFGTMKAETYFHLATPGISSLPDNIVYDSTRLLVVPDGNYYGDTTAPFTLQAYQLTEDLSLESNTYFYNTQHFSTATTPFATGTAIVRPGVKDTFSLALNNSIGTTLLRMIRTSSDTLTDNDHFYQYLKGVSIKGISTNKAVYSFSASTTTTMLRVYYHYSNPFPQTGYITSSLVADNLQFNHVETSRTGTPLQAFTPNTKQVISSTLTGNKSYIQTTGGLQIRIDLPSLRSFRTEDAYRKILKAEMYVRPYGWTSSSLYPLPATLTLYTATDDNIPGSVVLNKTTSSTQSIAPTIDYLYGQNTYYLFDISNYVNSVITGATDTYDGLFLETPAYSTNNAVDRLVLANAPLYKSIEIRIYRLAF